MTEREYRAHPGLNSSKIKDMDKNRMQYYRKYVLKEKVEEESNLSMIIGSLVDCMLFTPDEYEDRYTNYAQVAPIGQMGTFCSVLLNTSMQYLKDDIFTVSFSDRFSEAFIEHGLKFPDSFKNKKSDEVLELFVKPDKNGNKPSDYFENAIKNRDKTVIDLKTKNNADKLVKNLKTGKYTKWLFTPNKNLETHFQVPIIFNYLGKECKALLDTVAVNKKTKTVLGIDLKCTWQADGFSYNFVKMKYYLQGSFYHKALEQFMIDFNLHDYTLADDFYFLVCDTASQFVPHFWIMDKDVINKGRMGFTDKFGVYHKGYDQLINEIIFCEGINDFGDSLELNENNGKIKLIL